MSTIKDSKSLATRLANPTALGDEDLRAALRVLLDLATPRTQETATRKLIAEFKVLLETRRVQAHYGEHGGDTQALVFSAGVAGGTSAVWIDPRAGELRVLIGGMTPFSQETLRFDSATGTLKAPSSGSAIAWLKNLFSREVGGW